VPGRMNPAEQERPAVYFAIWGDTQCLAPADIEACARQLETVVVEAAFDGTAPTGLRGDHSGLDRSDGESVADMGEMAQGRRAG
jgi:hypothetical protein